MGWFDRALAQHCGYCKPSRGVVVRYDCAFDTHSFAPVLLMTPPLVSINIFVYNSAADVPAAIRSLRDLSFGVTVATTRLTEQHFRGLECCRDEGSPGMNRCASAAR